MANHYVTIGEAGLLDAAALMKANATSEFDLLLADATREAAWQSVHDREQREHAGRYPDTAHFYPVAALR